MRSFILIILILCFCGCEEDKPINNVDEISIYDEIPNLKLSLNVVLNDRVGESEIENIAYALFRKFDAQNYENFFIVYYLPHMEIGNGGYATSHFRPNLEVEIYGLTNEMISTIKEEYSDESFWIDDESQLLVYINEDNDNYELFQVDADLNTGSRPLRLEINDKGDSIFIDKNVADNAFYIMNSFGNIEVYDADGLIYTMFKE